MTTAEPADPRLADLLCPRHRRTAVDRWPLFVQPLSLFDECPDCTAARYRLCPELKIRVLPDLEPRHFENLSAFHEAAHTIAAIAAGHPVDHVSIERHEAAFTDKPAGGTALRPWSAPVIEHLVVLWAGQRAALRRLEELDLATEANLVDLAWQGAPDLGEIASWTTKYALPPEIGRDIAETFLVHNWPAIGELAAVLSREYHLTGEQAQRVVADHHLSLVIPA